MSEPKSAAPVAPVALQVSTIGALLEGHYEGSATFAELRSAGDFGLGTLDALDGEVIALDGAFYQVASDGSVRAVPDSATTPFAVVTFFRPNVTGTLPEALDTAGLASYLDRRYVDENLPYAVRVDGVFRVMRTRSIPRQRQPYPRLIDVTAKQPTFDFADVAGTLIGFRFPKYMAGLNVTGYHFHFLTADRKSGGHVLSFQVASGRFALTELSNVLLRLPTDAAFRRLPLGEDLSHEIEAAER